MKNTIIILCLFTMTLKAQNVDHIRMLLMRDDQEVIKYFDSLALATGKKIPIEKRVESRGNLIILANPDYEDLSFFGCSMIIMKFVRENGREICVGQRLTSNVVNIVSNLSYVKDNYKQISDAIWSDGKEKDKIYIRVKFDVTDIKNGFCTLDYDIFVN
jgi:hypothetical protein